MKTCQVSNFSIPRSYECELTNFKFHSEAQDSQGIVRILLDSIIILVKDPSRNVRVQASRALLNLGFDVSGRNLSSSKSTATDTSNPTLIKPNISGGMSSFLPKSWQAKSWRSFSSPVSKQVANDQVPRHSQEQERSLVRFFFQTSYIYCPGNKIKKVDIFFVPFTAGPASPKSR